MIDYSVVLSSFFGFLLSFLLALKLMYIQSMRNNRIEVVKAVILLDFYIGNLLSQLHKNPSEIMIEHLEPSLKDIAVSISLDSSIGEFYTSYKVFLNCFIANNTEEQSRLREGLEELKKSTSTYISNSKPFFNKVMGITI